MAFTNKESTIKNQAELNGAASKAYHYICGVCNSKTKEEFEMLGAELTGTIKDILLYKKRQFEGDTNAD